MLEAASRENKMNNNKSNITNMEERIKVVKKQANEAEGRNYALKQQDANQYHKISNKKEYIKSIIT